MLEDLEKFLNIAIAVGLSLVAMTFFQLEPNLAKVKAISELRESQKTFDDEIASIRASLDAIAAELETAKKSQEFVDAVAFAELEQKQHTHEESIRQLNSLFTSNPEKARQLHDVGQAYASLKDTVTRLEGRIDNVQSHLMSGVISNSGFYYGLALVLIGVVANTLLQRKSKGITTQ